MVLTYQLLSAHGEALLVQLGQITGLQLLLQLGLCFCDEVSAEKTQTTRRTLVQD